MKPRANYQEAIDAMMRALKQNPRGYGAEAILLAYALEVLLDVRDLLAHVETSTDRMDGAVQEIRERVAR